jgi:hypothetical protein
MSRSLISMLLMIMFPCLAFGADWSPYFTNRAGVTFFVDRSSRIVLKNGHVKVWEKQEFAKTDPAFGDGLLYLFEVDCADRRFAQKGMRPLKQTAENLKAVASIERLYEGWQDFEPNDLHEQRLKSWCGAR